MDARERRKAREKGTAPREREKKLEIGAHKRVQGRKRRGRKREQVAR